MIKTKRTRFWNNFKLMKPLIFLIFVILFSISVPVFAVIQEKGGISSLLPDAPINKLSGLNATDKSVEYAITQIVKWIYAVFWIVAVGFVIWAAFTFLFANGEEAKITEAKKRLFYAVIAAIVATIGVAIDVVAYYLLGGQ